MIPDFLASCLLGRTAAPGDARMRDAMGKKPESLEDKMVLVTGAASGIGRQLAKDLYWNEGCRLVLVDVNAGELDVLRMELEPPEDSVPGQKPRVEAFTCDISSSESVAGLKRSVGRRKLDVLINNAGITYLGSFEKMDFDDFERVIQVNLLGTVRITKAFLLNLLTSAKPYVVNVASMAGLVGAPGLSAYVASKFGICGFSDAIGTELEGRVGVGTVCPTFVKTNIARNALYEAGAKDTSRRNRAGRADSFLSSFGANPKKVSSAVIRTIKERKKLVLVNPDAYMFYYLHRFFPGLSERFAAIGYRMLIAAGVVDP